MKFKVRHIFEEPLTGRSLSIKKGLFLNEEPPSLVVHSPDSNEITIIPLDVVKVALASGDDNARISVPLGALLRSMSNWDDRLWDISNERSKES